MTSIYRTRDGLVINRDGRWLRDRERSIDDVFGAGAGGRALDELPAVPAPEPSTWLPPIGSQEVWAAGVTYKRSREARVEESERSGANRLYDMVYEAERPELFFKATAARVRGPGQSVRIRTDGSWNVPEPELTLAVDCRGGIIGFTIGNDMSSRDIEGENPLYLPQAKIYRGSCALGPALVLSADPLPGSTQITCAVERGGAVVFSGETTLDRMKRRLDELVSWLFRELDFPNGVYLMTGTGIVPPSTFSLAAGDRIRIGIDGLGVLENTVEA